MGNAARTPRTKDLVITRVFAAPLESTWRAWTEPDLVRQWWGPDGFTSPSADIDFREGGTSLLCMRPPAEWGGEDSYSTWTYTRIVPMELIEYVHNLTDRDGRKVDPVSVHMPADFPRDQRHVVAFDRLDEHKTQVTVTEYGWPVGRMMEFSRMGMEQCLAKMAGVLP